MDRKRYALLFVPVFFAATLAIATPSPAMLGGTADSIAADRKAISAVPGVMTSHSGYTVQAIVSDATTVREYLSPSGIVFGIAWNGLTHPDLTPLLGAYAKEYQEGLLRASRKPGRRYLRVKTDRVVVEKWGHMRNLQGRAYVPALIPKGVSVDDIK